MSTLVATPSPAPREEPADIDTAELFGDRSEIRIRHAGAIYRLRITRGGKLILTK
jgi:hemin uptake protein HemP